MKEEMIATYICSGCGTEINMSGGSVTATENCTTRRYHEDCWAKVVITRLSNRTNEPVEYEGLRLSGIKEGQHFKVGFGDCTSMVEYKAVNGKAVRVDRKETDQSPEPTQEESDREMIVGLIRDELLSAGREWLSEKEPERSYKVRDCQIPGLIDAYHPMSWRWFCQELLSKLFRR